MAEPGPGPLPASSNWSVPGSLIACPALTRHKCIKINCGKLEYRTSKVYTIFPHFFWYIWYFILNNEKEKENPFDHGYFEFTKVISDTFPLSCLTVYEGTCYLSTHAYIDCIIAWIALRKFWKIKLLLAPKSFWIYVVHCFLYIFVCTT